MKVSYYELLGMIKYNKQPKKVMFNNNIYIWNDKNYRDEKSEQFLSNHLIERGKDESNRVARRI